jgi:hypothetical protein
VTTCFYNIGYPSSCARPAAPERGATVFAYYVRDPERYGKASPSACRQRLGGRSIHELELASDSLIVLSPATLRRSGRKRSEYPPGAF